MEAQQARARRPPLMIVTNIAQQQTSAKRINAAVFPHSSISHGLLKTRTLSSSSTCVISPSSSCAAAPMAPPPAPSMVRTANQRNNTPMSTPTASARSRGSKYCSDPDGCRCRVLERITSKTSICSSWLGPTRVAHEHGHVLQATQKVTSPRTLGAIELARWRK
jgi:hypothetical protein